MYLRGFLRNDAVLCRASESAYAEFPFQLGSPLRCASYPWAPKRFAAGMLQTFYKHKLRLLLSVDVTSVQELHRPGAVLNGSELLQMHGYKHLRHQILPY